jgi:GntR family transcriptional regulator
MSGASSFPYHRIAEDLRAEISDGRRNPGERLPSEHELADRYVTSRPTVRRAIALLKAEGLIVTEQGKGAFVRPKPRVRLLISGSDYRRHQAAGVPGFNAQVIEQGQVPEQRLREVATIEAPEEIAQRLDLDTNDAVVVRRRLFIADGTPVAICDSYYPADLAEGTAIAENRKVKGGVYRIIEDPCGPIRRQIARSLEDLVSRMPTHGEAELLVMPQGVPVVRVLRTVYDSEDCPVEVQDSIVAADRHEFRYEVQMR